MLNAFTVDIEDYFQVSAFDANIDRNAWDEFPHRVVDNSSRLLDLLAKKEVLATFFVLGWVADKFPALIRRIAAEGHELASHSYWHRLVYKLSPEEFRTDLRRSKQAIEDAAGVCVNTYRAPSFSITNESIWALDVLSEEGFTVDSSVFPIVHGRCGIPGTEICIHQMQTKSGALWQFPPSVAKVAGLNLPISGGGYFRLYPFMISCHYLRRINTTAGAPFMFYVHPWEIDPDQPRMSFASGSTRFRHYVNLRSTHDKLEKLLENFRFGRISDVVAKFQAESTEPSLCGAAR